MQGMQEHLPPGLVNRINGIVDATWWITNKGAPLDKIKWPVAWMLTEPPLHRRPPLSGAKPPAPTLTERQIPKEVVEEFDAFAKKVCRSPELSYLTMMALLYNETNNPEIKARFEEARAAVNKHLRAIDRIAGI